MRKWITFGVACSILALTGCGDSGSPPAADKGPPVEFQVSDSKVGEGIVQPDGPVTDGKVTDGPVTDGPQTDGPVVGPDRKEGEITGGGGISQGGSYTLFSQVGHAMGTISVAGGGYALHWNASVIPW
jgi:hypothetical protein